MHARKVTRNGRHVQMFAITADEAVRTGRAGSDGVTACDIMLNANGGYKDSRRGRPGIKGVESFLKHCHSGQRVVEIFRNRP